MLVKKKRPRVSKTPLLLMFGANVRLRRHELRISQEKLAELADLDATYISNIEQGRRNLSLETANNIAKSLGLTLSEMLQESHE